METSDVEFADLNIHYSILHSSKTIVPFIEKPLL